jgi:hypothetical protein
MSESPLSTYAGPIAATAGGLFAATQLAMFLTADRSDLVAMMSDPLFLVLNGAYAATFPLLLIALVALYWRQAAEAGLLGAIAFCIAATGTMALAGDMWFEGFAVPWLAQVAPSVFTAARTGTLLMGWLVSVILFSLGWTLFGFTSLRARVLPPALSIALAIGGLLGFQAAMPPWGIALGLAVSAVGAWLIRHDLTSRRDQTPPVTKPDAVAHR